MKKLNTKVERIKLQVKKKNKDKVEKYKLEKEKEDIAELAIIPKECKDYEKLKVFTGETIHQEDPKPPVITCSDIILTEDELAILKRGPKFTLRNTLSKEDYMAEVEKGLIKKKYDMIGKEEIEGKVVEDDLEEEDEEDRRIREEAEWQEVKSSMIYDFENKEMDFGRSRATNWKGNKRIVLPKSGSTHLEAYLEIRRKTASKIWDQCMEMLGEGVEAGMDNLTEAEKRGLKSLKKRVANKELIICQTDKSGRFCVLSWDRYIQAGEKHTRNDKKISIEESEEIQGTLNGHMRWWSALGCPVLHTHHQNITPLGELILYANMKSD